MNRKFSNKFHSHWVKVKFYNEIPDSNNYKKPTGIRFCQAVNQAILHPVILTKEGISCPGARYVFGLEDNTEDIIKFWQGKRGVSKKIAQTILKKVAKLKEPFNCIGLNSDDEPDLLVSYLTPEDAMDVLAIYHNYNGEILNFDISSVMTICGNIAVKTFLDHKLNISFGCDEARNHGNIGRERLAIGIPRGLCDIFI